VVPPRSCRGGPHHGVGAEQNLRRRRSRARRCGRGPRCPPG
jgi:hypothetical protein